MFKLRKNTENAFLDKIRIKFSRDIAADEVQKLYLSVGWQYREVQDIKKSIEKSVLVASVWLDENLIGFARATGDGIYNATIWDVAVKPSFQSRGVGSFLIKSMLTKLDSYGIPLITLYTECAKKNFYSKFGFESNFNKIIGMYRSRKHI